MSPLLRYRRLLRPAFLALLVLGMVISPTLAGVSELHDMEHAAEGAGHGAHVHMHSDSGHHGPVDPDEADPEHASGAHGLLHQAGSVSVTLPQAAVDISVLPMAGPLLTEFSRSHLPGDSPTNPFRPPIA